MQRKGFRDIFMRDTPNLTYVTARSRTHRLTHETYFEQKRL